MNETMTRPSRTRHFNRCFWRAIASRTLASFCCALLSVPIPTCVLWTFDPTKSLTEVSLVLPPPVCCHNAFVAVSHCVPSCAHLEDVGSLQTLSNCGGSKQHNPSAGVRRLLEVLEERSFEEIQVAGNQVSRALCDHFNAVVTGAAGSTPEIAERPNRLVLGLSTCFFGSPHVRSALGAEERMSSKHSSPAKSTAGPSGDFASQRSPGCVSGDVCGQCSVKCCCLPDFCLGNGPCDGCRRGNHQSQGSPLSLKGMTVQELKQEVERLRAEMVDMERRHREELSLEQRRHLDEEKRLFVTHWICPHVLSLCVDCV